MLLIFSSLFNCKEQSKIKVKKTAYVQNQKQKNKEVNKMIIKRRKKGRKNKIAKNPINRLTVRLFTQK